MKINTYDCNENEMPTDYPRALQGMRVTVKLNPKDVTGSVIDWYKVSITIHQTRHSSGSVDYRKETAIFA